MTTNITQPFNQKYRFAALRLGFLVLVPFILIVHPILDETLFGEIMEQSGLLLVIAGVLGRFWSTLYIGGHKSETVMQSAPYPMCRHPLYLFSPLGTFGFGLMLQSIVLALLIGIVVFSILNLTASREEAFLRSEFGPDFDAYARRVPRIVPDFRLFATVNDVTISIRHLRVNFFDALVFMFLIPLAKVVEWVRASEVLPTIFLP